MATLPHERTSHLACCDEQDLMKLLLINRLNVGYADKHGFTQPMIINQK